MEVTGDQRINVIYSGEKGSQFMFANDETKRYMLCEKACVMGASILDKHSKYRLRKLPGQAYLVEASLC